MPSLSPWVLSLEDKKSITSNESERALDDV